jgi:hypothetical protein
MPQVMYSPAPMSAQWSGSPSAPPAAQRPAALPRPKIRAQSPEEPARNQRSSPLRIPTPEQLGIARFPAPERTTTLDWSKAHQQFDRLGAVGVQREHLPMGTYRISCLLPTAAADRHHHIAVEAASEAEAVHLVLEKANDWARQTQKP